MKNNTGFVAGLFLTLFISLEVGCSSSSENDAPGAMSQMAAQLEASEQAAANQTPEPSNQAPRQRAPIERSEPTAVTSNSTKKGSTLRNQGSYLSAVGAARFSAEHKMIYNQVTQALNLYQASNGYYPKSHEIFMKEIIAVNSIQLPELMDGMEYWYDASDHILKERPISTEGQSAEE